MVQAFEDALVRNMRGRVVRRADAALAPGGRYGPAPVPDHAREIEAVGRTRAGERRLVARFFLFGDRFYELIVIGDPALMPAEAVDTFTAGFQPVAPARPS